MRVYAHRRVARNFAPRVAGQPRGARRGALLKFSGTFRADQQTACAGNLSPIFANGGSRRRPVGRPCPATLWKSAGAVVEGTWRGRPVSRLDRTYGKKLRRPAAVIFSLRPDPTQSRPSSRLEAVVQRQSPPDGRSATLHCPLFARFHNIANQRLLLRIHARQQAPLNQKVPLRNRRLGTAMRHPLWPARPKRPNKETESLRVSRCRKILHIILHCFIGGGLGAPSIDP